MPDFSFHHGAASVPDLEAAIAWYDRILDFKVEKRFYVEPAKAQAAMLRKGALRIELFAPEDADPLPDGRRHPPQDLLTHGNKHVAFKVDDLETFLEEMTEKDADIAFVVRESFGRACFLRDCAGNLIEFVEEKDR
jgi:catechol 2,3-dioxygenase-like lactoylglutathione lyase family enzyme